MKNLEAKEHKPESDEVLIKNILDYHGFKKLNMFNDFKKYFDIDNLDADKTPKIMTDKNTIIIFDNHKYNECYLLDVMNKWFDQHQSHLDILLSTNLLYVDSPMMRKALFCPAFTLDDYSTIEILEKDFLMPTIMIINPFDNQFTYFQETIVPFDAQQIDSILTWLNIDK